MIYMPMIPEAAAAMLACARIGAIHSVVFGGFSPESLAGRIADCDASAVITADEGVRGGKVIPLKRNVDEALELPEDVATVIVVTRTGADVPMKDGRDVCYSDGPRQPRHRLRARGDGRGGPACSSSTRRARPESPRASSTPPAAMRCGRRRPSTGCSTADPTTSSGAPPTSAGSPATPMSSTAR